MMKPPPSPLPPRQRQSKDRSSFHISESSKALSAQPLKLVESAELEDTWNVVANGKRSIATPCRTVTPHPWYPTTASIETVWESITINTNDNDVSTAIEAGVGWNHRTTHRIAVYSGPDGGSSRSLHVSLQLPTTAVPPEDTRTPVSTTNHSPSGPQAQQRLCWTTFGSSTLGGKSSSNDEDDSTKTEHTLGHHPVLCCLVNTNTLTIWDVYPTASRTNAPSSPQSVSSSLPLPSEGWTVTLPFECRSIWTAAHGLLLQRLFDPDDDDVENETMDSQSNNNSMDVSDDDRFVLQGPPAWKHRLQQFQSSQVSGQMSPHLSVPSPFAAQSPRANFGGTRSQQPAMPSLFSLHHPFEDVLPVALSQPHTLNGVSLMTDVEEQIVFVGTAIWSADEKNCAPTIATVIVTYHAKLCRRAVYSLHDAPKPPAQLSLHERTRQQYSIGRRGYDDSLWHDLDVLSLQPNGTDDDVVRQRNRKEPSSDRKDMAWPGASREQALADALGVGRTGSHLHTAPSSLRKPNRYGGGGAPNVSNLHSPRALDLSHTPALTPSSAHGSGDFFGVSGSTAVVSNDDNVIHPKLSVTLVHTDERNSAPSHALDTQVYLVQTEKASWTLMWYSCHEQTLRRSKILPPTRKTTSEKFEGLKMVPLATLIDVAAVQPIQALNFAPTASADLALMDLLVLSNQGKLSLHRASGFAIELEVPCSVTQRNGVVTDVKDGRGDRVSLIVRMPYVSPKPSPVVLRCCLGLESLLGSHSTAQSVLTALHGSPGLPDDLSMAMRADATRLVQTVETDAFAAVRAVVLQLVREELGWTGKSTTHDSLTRPHSAWQSLLATENEFSQEWVESVPVGLRRKEVARNENLWTDPVVCNLNPMVSRDVVHKENVQVFHHIFDALHLMYEDCKLLVDSAGGQPSIAIVELLIELCFLYRTAIPHQKGKVETFLDYYRRDMDNHAFDAIVQTLPETTVAPPEAGDLSSKVFSLFDTPPSIHSFLDHCMRDTNASMVDDSLYSAENRFVNPACKTTLLLLKLFPILFERTSGSNNDTQAIAVLVGEGYTDPVAIRESLIPSAGLPILELLHRCRNSENTEWSREACMLIGRQDVSFNMFPGGAIPDPGIQTRQNERLKDSMTHTGEPVSENEDKDGLVALERSSAMLFSADNRVHEAARLVRSSQSIFLRVDRGVGVSDHDFESSKQARLMLLGYRALALPVGRGMLTIGSLDPVPAEPLPQPEICLKGRVPPTNAIVKLDTSECPPELKVWPEFHNGVAAGLRLPQLSHTDQNRPGFSVSRTWIVYNRPPSTRSPPQDSADDADPSPPQSYFHGGLLLALGLRGHLVALEMSDIYDYLTQGTVTTTVGVLLGLAANKRGSCDISVSKMICLHIPSLIPQHFSAIDVASTVQTAAVTSAGLLFQGSSHRMMTEFLLNEIGKRPDTDVNTTDREAYTLACGLALGTVNLCIGNTKSEFRSAGLADLHIEERLIRYIVGGIDEDENERIRESNDRFSLPNSTNGNESEKCSTIFESGSINTGITSSGATLALGFMYMKSENQSVASALKLPDTHFLLEFVRPDFLGIRVIARSLILWNDVKPTSEWIDNQVPLVVRSAFDHMSSCAKNAYGMHSPEAKTNHNVEYDGRAVRQIHAHVVAGACFGIGIRFAGTGNKEAKATLYKKVLELHSMREASDPVATAIRPELPILDTCLGSAALSLALVLAGTGDLETLKLFKMLRWRCDADSKYGIHLIFGMAIGLLFLGGGKCTIGREPEDIAALVTAFFPRFPVNTSDNQFHLQALRHLYALAVRNKELRAIDVESGESVYVPVQLRFNHIPEPQPLQVPCLLPNSDMPIKDLRILSEKYYPLTLDIGQFARTYVFYVKKRNAQLLRPISSSLPQEGHKRDFTESQEIQSLTDNHFLKAFASFFCDFSNPQQFLSRALLECLMEDTEEALPIYLFLAQGIQSLKNVRSTEAICFLHTLGSIRTYYRERAHLSGGTSRPLVHTKLLLPLLQEIVDKSLSMGTLEENVSLIYAESSYS